MIGAGRRRVRVVNRTGHAAKLLLSGTSKGVLAGDAATEVVFRRGTTSVALSRTARSATTSRRPDHGRAVGRRDARSDPGAGGRRTQPPSRLPRLGGGPASGRRAPPRRSRGRAGPALRDGAAARRARPRPASTVEPGARRPRAPAMPAGGAASRLKTRTPQRTAGIGAPAFAGMPPGDERRFWPAYPTLELAPVAPDAAPAAPGLRPLGSPRRSRWRRCGRCRESGPIGLLGVIAAVCVIGVAPALIRAIVSQRANRANCRVRLSLDRLRGAPLSNLIGVVVPPQVPPSECGSGAPRLFAQGPRQPDGALFGCSGPRGYAGSVRRGSHGRGRRPADFLLRATQDLLPRRDRGRLAHRR